MRRRSGTMERFWRGLRDVSSTSSAQSRRCTTSMSGSGPGSTSTNTTRRTRPARCAPGERVRANATADRLLHRIVRIARCAFVQQLPAVDRWTITLLRRQGRLHGIPSSSSGGKAGNAGPPAIELPRQRPAACRSRSRTSERTAVATWARSPAVGHVHSGRRPDNVRSFARMSSTFPQPVANVGFSLSGLASPWSVGSQPRLQTL